MTDVHREYVEEVETILGSVRGRDRETERNTIYN